MSNGKGQPVQQGSPRLVVLWDIPGPARGMTTFYRRLGELLDDHGGIAHCRASRSAYVVSGDGAVELAYAIGVLAETYGAGAVGEQEGVQVLPIGDLAPARHFAALAEARLQVEHLCRDRRKRGRQIAKPAIPTGEAGSGTQSLENGEHSSVYRDPFSGGTP